MKYTLLEMVQLIMSSLDSDEVNSINDTTESQQVVNIIRTVYNDIITRADLPEHKTLFSLDASGDSSKPVLMTVPSTIQTVDWVQYNKETSTATDMAFSDVTPMALKDFLAMTDSLAESDTVVLPMSHSIGSSTITFLYRNDAAPSFYTCFDDNTLIFDSYDSAVDTTLQASKTRCQGLVIPTFTESNAFTPDLDANLFTLLFNESKALAWAELKQAQHVKAEVASKRGWIKQQQSRENVKGPTFFDTLPNYGRK